VIVGAVRSAAQRSGARRREAGDPPPRGPRAGFTLVETLIALVLLGFAALAAASAQAWAARMVATAEAREAGVVAAELVLDSLAALPRPGAGFRIEGTVRLDWTVVPGRAGREVRLRVRGGDAAGDAWFGAVVAPPPEELGAAP